MMQDEYILHMQSISKSFGGVHALSNVELKVKKGSIHAICGENGAGKSTLMKILSGVYPYGEYGGTIFYMGKEMKFKNIKDSEKSGIVIIHQELTMIPELSVAENIFLGNEITKNGFIDWKSVRLKTKEMLERVGLNIDPDIAIKHLGVGQQQLVEIAKALSKDVKLLILDEPTSALNETDSQNLLNLMVGLKEHGISCIMISHKLNEISQVSDSVTVIRDGVSVDYHENIGGHIDENEIIRSMVGRSIENRYPEHESNIGDVIFEVKDWTVEDDRVEDRLLCKGSSFYVRAGEIVGFAGLMGAGRTELMRSVFGKNMGIYRSGKIFIKGKEVKINSVEDAIKCGIAYVPEDRKIYGLNLIDSIKKTVVSANLDDIKSGFLLDDNKELRVAKEYKESLKIKAENVFSAVNTLSGGNQQKVVLAKWMFTNPDVLILDEPTRGIDVGAKYEIYKLIHELAAKGTAVILVSSELPELLGIVDRIYTIFEGRITGELSVNEATQESLMRKMTITSTDAQEKNVVGMSV